MQIEKTTLSSTHLDKKMSIFIFFEFSDSSLAK